MKPNPSSVVRSMAVAVPLLATLVSGPAWAADVAATGEQIRPVDAQKLPNVPGKMLSAVVVSYAPGGRSTKHHHSGSVWAFVLSGSIRSENSVTGPVRVYKAGESFFEPPGSKHLVSEKPACSPYSWLMTAPRSSRTTGSIDAI